MSISEDQLDEEIFEMVKESDGVKPLKPGGVIKDMAEKYGDDGVTKKDVKAAIKRLVDAGKIIYGYFGGSSLQLPHKEASAND